VPYPGAVSAARRWHEEGHFIHITSHRALDRKDATVAWLKRIGLPFDDLHCSYDKVSRCTELKIDLLIDDGPLNLAAALERGIAAATIEHPWNRDVCEEEDILCARDWIELKGLLEPIIGVKAASLAHSA
jgi:uncharacterized HAD superfamily protein